MSRIYPGSLWEANAHRNRCLKVNLKTNAALFILSTSIMRYTVMWTYDIDGNVSVLCRFLTEHDALPGIIMVNRLLKPTRDQPAFLSAKLTMC